MFFKHYHKMTYLFAGPFRLPSEVPEEVCGCLDQSVGGGGVSELLDHGGQESGGRTEEGLDVQVAEGEVGEGDDRVTAHFRAGGAGRHGRGLAEVAVNIALDLKEESFVRGLKLTLKMNAINLPE